MPEMCDWVPPESFDEYRLVKALGRGSMGQVWSAHDTVLDRLVAVKFIAELPDHDAVRQRFLTEARAAARVQHPNIIAIYRVGEIGARPYLISEYVRGESLDKLARPVAWSRLLEIAIGLARGLAAAHRQGVLHRDIKPANAIVSETGEVKLLDFGLAKLLPQVAPQVDAPPDHEAAAMLPGDPTLAPRASSEARAPAFAAHPRAIDLPASVPATVPDGRIAPSVTNASTLMGTAGYMPPEAWRGEPATLRSDVYSLGALLYELAAGAPPYLADAPDAVRGSATAGAPLPLAKAGPGIAPGFAAIVDRCLRRDPAERFASGDAVREALEALAAGDKAAATVLARRPPERPTSRLRRALVAGAALAVAVVAYNRFAGQPLPPPGGAAADRNAQSEAPAQRHADAPAREAGSLSPGDEPGCPRDMVAVPAGRFLMGSPEGEGDANEHPQHEATVSAYCIDRTEVTVAAYAACVAAKGCREPRLTTNSTVSFRDTVNLVHRWCNRADRPDHPINCVDWDEAAAYCSWNGKRLPTEVEWEYAARGNDGRVYPWGNEAPGVKRLNACGTECVAILKRVEYSMESMYDGDDGWEATAPVGSYPEGASPFGVLDMAGNVSEWTADWYIDYAQRAEANPQGPSTEMSRVFRGGGWNTRGTDKVRVTARDWPEPTLRTIDLGFRCARGR